MVSTLVGYLSSGKDNQISEGIGYVNTFRHVRYPYRSKNQIDTDSFVQVFRRIRTTSKNVRVIHSHNGSNFVGSKT